MGVFVSTDGASLSVGVSVAADSGTVLAGVFVSTGGAAVPLGVSDTTGDTTVPAGVSVDAGAVPPSRASCPPSEGPQPKNIIVIPANRMKLKIFVIVDPLACIGIRPLSR